jgi:hypothetical protein
MTPFFSRRQVKYADWLDHETEIEQLKLERTALEAESTDGAQPKRQSSLNAAKDKMRTMRTAAHAAAASLKKVFTGRGGWPGGVGRGGVAACECRPVWQME